MLNTQRFKAKSTERNDDNISLQARPKVDTLNVFYENVKKYKNAPSLENASASSQATIL